MTRFGILFLICFSVLIVSCESLRRGAVRLLSLEKYSPGPVPSEASGVSAIEVPDDKTQALKLERVAGGFDGITDVQFLPGENFRAVVLQKNGDAFIINLKDGVRRKLFSVSVATTSELGLLGFAFHPRFSESKKFYVHYNPKSDLSRVSEWEWVESSDRLAIECREKRVIFEVEQPYQNHNGGSVVFGPDQKLYVGLGDGGWRGDPENRAQDMGSFLGKMLRIDVEQSVGGKYKPEIFASGLRNPWKYSFDSRGRLVAGDVGQDKWEEVTFVEKGANLGWRLFEGSHCYDPPEECGKRAPDLVGPVAEYDHSLGVSVTGGFEYMGAVISALRGRYLFGDFATGRIWSIVLPEKTPVRPMSGKGFRFHGRWPILISTFARDVAGEIYVADYSGGNIYRISSGN